MAKSLRQSLPKFVYLDREFPGMISIHDWGRHILSRQKLGVVWYTNVCVAGFQPHRLLNMAPSLSSHSTDHQLQVNYNIILINKPNSNKSFIIKSQI